MSILSQLFVEYVEVLVELVELFEHLFVARPILLHNLLGLLKLGRSKHIFDHPVECIAKLASLQPGLHKLDLLILSLQVSVNIFFQHGMILDVVILFLVVLERLHLLQLRLNALLILLLVLL